PPLTSSRDRGNTDGYVPAPVATPTSAHAPPVSATYFSFKDYLSEEDATQFFELAHSAQVEKVAQYLDFLGNQPAAAQFTTSSKASISFASSRDDSENALEWWQRRADALGLGDDESVAIDSTVLDTLLTGRTRSGFGAFGTEEGFLPQKQLSLAVANIVEDIGHEYIVECNKKGEIRSPALNSRSFFFYWCHAEKQKILDIRQKLSKFGVNGGDPSCARLRKAYWSHVVVIVDRAMCLDCIQFAACFARSERIYLLVEDPNMLRIFPPDRAERVEMVS
uniref:Single-strand DNA deaminase toxin A-like C-terminal domain-containing protein n=1 Tax=Globisporangium ultimum (strain ATCC 200006 / CBS 805.95 / DAOM BR144) TaxID=431595 RepID=K3WBC7_GLOUD